MKPSTQEHITWMEGQYKEMFVQILNQTALLEDKIDELITLSFFGKDTIKWEFVDIILGDMILSQKIIKLQRTLKTLQPEIFEDFKQKEVVKRFNKIRKVRNIFAHSVLDTSPKYAAKQRKDEIALFNFRYNPPHAQIIFEDFVKYIEDSKVLYELLGSYCALISKEK